MTKQTFIRSAAAEGIVAVCNLLLKRAVRLERQVVCDETQMTRDLLDALRYVCKKGRNIEGVKIDEINGMMKKRINWGSVSSYVRWSACRKLKAVTEDGDPRIAIRALVELYYAMPEKLRSSADEVISGRDKRLFSVPGIYVLAAVAEKFYTNGFNLTTEMVSAIDGVYDSNCLRTLINLLPLRSSSPYSPLAQSFERAHERISRLDRLASGYVIHEPQL